MTIGQPPALTILHMYCTYRWYWMFQLHTWLPFSMWHQELTAELVYNLSSPVASSSLSSTLDGRQAACPGEVVTYTCSVTQAFTLGWTATPVLVNPSLLRFTTFAPAGRMVGCSDIAAIQCADFDFLATLISVGAVVNSQADMTSTFRFTARPGLNGTVVECSGLTIPSTPSANHTLTIAGKW